jgi:membrane dipeptidase
MSRPVATEVIRSAVVWDNHACMPLRAEDDFLPHLARHRRSGYTVVSLNVGYDQTTLENDVRVLAQFRRWIRANSGDYLLIERAQDVAEAKRTGRLGVCFDLEGTVALGDQLSMVELYYELGVRWMLMAYNRRNSVGGGCLEDGPLTSFGRAVLDEMQRVGMVPCCSHTSWNTAREVLDYVDGPVIFSHSNSNAVYTHPRNIPDDLAKVCAASGGVISVNGYGPFVGRRSDGGGDNSTEGLFRHLDHFVQLLGPQHVGLGLDYVFDVEEVRAYFRSNPEVFPPAAGYTEEMPMVEPERLTALVQMMIDHGYPTEAIVQIVGGNHLRVAKTCWH